MLVFSVHQPHFKMSSASHHTGRGSSSEASNSTTLSEGLSRAMRFSTLAEQDLRSSDESSFGLGSDEDPWQALKRTLSVKSVISTSSSNASRMQRASAATDRGEFRTIGLGSCGSVFEIPGTELAYKKGSVASDMWMDFCLTNRVHLATTSVLHC